MLWFNCDGLLPGISIAICFLAVSLAGFLGVLEHTTFSDVDYLCSMAEGSANNREMFRQGKKTAVVLGYTGETGQALVKQLAKENLFSKVTLIGRRIIPLNESERPEFEQKVVDFENLEEHRDAFSGHDVGFWCLGTTRAKAGVEGFKRVDHDYVLKSAEMAKAGGLKHLHFMSTMGADHRGMALYTKTKGQVEEALKVMHFARLSIYRPGVLMVNRQESRPMEAIARFLLVPVAKVFPTAITIPVESVAQAMINNAVSDKGKSVETFENKDIHVLSGISGHCPKS
ncbi:oxidoreductase HTATIP2-like [Mya arenaria]|uniref:oxidoreductase HTATIP2-like n=1 Tax=Mya arenaria TaxID=6604 RepID=UPI0022DEBE74|nr:oxidoreductase HTATIP2-like [Mya arenaria]